MTYTTTVELQGREYEIEIEYSYRPGSRATRDHPGDGAEVDVGEARLVLPVPAGPRCTTLPPWSVPRTTRLLAISEDLLYVLVPDLDERLIEAGEDELQARREDGEERTERLLGTDPDGQFGAGA